LQRWLEERSASTTESGLSAEESALVRFLGGLAVAE
jgi:hypothetical protein